MRKAKERPVSAATIKITSKKYFALRRLISDFRPKRFFLRKSRESKKSIDAPIGQT
jgi:hypothetical protein